MSESSIAKLYQEMQDFMSSGKRGEANYDSTKQPFFIQNPLVEESNNSGMLLRETNMILENLGGELVQRQQSIPPRLTRLYKIIGDPSVEYYFDRWSLFPLRKIIDRRDVYLEHGQNSVIDFATCYMGMGHIIVASWDPNDKQVFYRRDGGSNGYERKENFEFIKSYSPTGERHKTLFQDWMNNIKNDPFKIKVINWEN